MATLRVAYALAISVISGCSAADPRFADEPGGAATEVTVPMFPRSEVERDLALELSRKISEPFERQREPGFEVVLVNRSPDRTYPVVISDDGSDAGWREPHVWYTVERRSGGGAWQAAPALRYSRCGNFQEDWHKDVVPLASGAKLNLPWFPFYWHWDLDGATHARVTAHYAYGDQAKDRRKIPPILHQMPAYDLRSNALEFELTEVVRLELKLHGALPLRSGELLAPAIEVTATNCGAAPVPFATSDTGASLAIELEYEGQDGTLRLEELDTGVVLGEAQEVLAPGERRAVVGPTTKTERYSSLPENLHVLRVRARLQISSAIKDDFRIASSPWVRVP